MADVKILSNCSEIVILMDGGLKSQLEQAVTAPDGLAEAAQAGLRGPLFKLTLSASAKICVSLNPEAVPSSGGKPGDRYVLVLEPADTCEQCGEGNVAVVCKNNHPGD